MESVTGLSAASTSESVAQLDVSRAFQADHDRLCAALTNPAWLGELMESPPGRPDLIRVETDLAFTLQADGRALVFRKAALVDIGIRPGGTGGCTGEVGWRAASFSPLFPVFAGQLTVTPSRIQLQGVYAPPGRQLGTLVDRAMIHGFAERTGRWFLDRLVMELREMDMRAAGH